MWLCDHLIGEERDISSIVITLLGRERHIWYFDHLIGEERGISGIVITSTGNGEAYLAL